MGSRWTCYRRSASVIAAFLAELDLGPALAPWRRGNGEDAAVTLVLGSVFGDV
jgi:hypothetical protein